MAFCKQILKELSRSLAALLTISASCMAADTGPVAKIAPPESFRGFAPRTTLHVRRNAHSVVADDMNGDGRIDLIVAVASANSVAFFAGLGDGRFAEATYWPVGIMPKFAATGDFNGDGLRDIVSADQDSNSISLLLGNGDGTFKPKVSFPACNGAHEVAVADFNGDGKDDVVVACHRQPYFASVFLGTGDGGFQPREDLAAGAEPTAVVVGDFNRDGIPDLAFANRAADAVMVLLGNGDGTFKQGIAYPTGASPHAVRTADLNGDGNLDLVTTNDRSNTISILYGKGDGTFSAHTDFVANSSPKSIALADVNGDGRPDIIVTNTTYPTCCTVEGSTVSVFLNLGNGSFAPRRDYYAGGNPFSLLVRDIDGDGKADILTANFVDQTDAQHTYLEATHPLGLPARMTRLVVLATIAALGAIVTWIGWRKLSVPGLLSALLLTAGSAYWFHEFSRPRTLGDSHISILHGQ